MHLCIKRNLRKILRTVSIAHKNPANLFQAGLVVKDAA
jgi:hypothetical protein